MYPQMVNFNSWGKRRQVLITPDCTDYYFLRFTSCLCFFCLTLRKTIRCLFIDTKWDLRHFYHNNPDAHHTGLQWAHTFCDLYKRNITLDHMNIYSRQLIRLPLHHNRHHDHIHNFQQYRTHRCNETRFRLYYRRNLIWLIFLQMGLQK